MIKQRHRGNNDDVGGNEYSANHDDILGVGDAHNTQAQEQIQRRINTYLMYTIYVWMAPVGTVKYKSLRRRNDRNII